MRPLKRTARIAGAWYLLMGLGTAFGMGYVNPLLHASGDGAVTARTLQASEWLFHAGFAGTAVGLIAMLFLASALYELFEAVDRGQARLLVIFVVAGVSMALVNLVNLLAALQLSRGDVWLAASEPAQRNGLMMAFLAAYWIGGQLASVLWGLWLLPFGLLILRSGFAPRVLGVLMVIGCFAYLFFAAAWLLFPNLGPIAQQGLLIPTLGEVGTILWLLIVGVTERRPASTSKPEQAVQAFEGASI
jgi:hypothetical protein